MSTILEKIASIEAEVCNSFNLISYRSVYYMGNKKSKEIYILIII